MQAEKLVRMANQIAANFDFGSDKKNAVASVVEADLVATALKTFAESLDTDWEGSSTALLAKLEIGKAAPTRDESRE